jgi:lysophospholipase L1-like esterase
MLSLLCLGDSYTIGEAVPVIESFPYQLVQLLRRKNIDCAAPEIIARTGWTTDELQAAINGYAFLPAYDWVTLLIGVNNQYRGRGVDTYEPEFEHLLQQAIAKAGGRTDRVLVLSIPDWGVTPFAKDRDRAAIASAIDTYNNVAKKACTGRGVRYTDITESTREAEKHPERVAGDFLHPSGKEYAIWAEKLLRIITA